MDRFIRTAVEPSTTPPLSVVGPERIELSWVPVKSRMHSNLPRTLKLVFVTRVSIDVPWLPRMVRWADRLSFSCVSGLHSRR